MNTLTGCSAAVVQGLRRLGLTAGVVLCLLGAPQAWAEAPAAACPPQPELPSREMLRQAQQQATDRGFLWRISRGGRDSYLYGTLHAGRPHWFALGPQVEAALYRTGVLALEINVTDPAVMAALREASQRPPRALPTELMQALQTAWQAECLPLGDLERGAPELHATQLVVAQAQRRGLFPHYGAESVLLMRSLQAQRPVTGLETVQTQLSALMARDDAEAAQVVRELLEELRQPRTLLSLERLARAWETGLLSDLERYAEWCDCLHTPEARAAYERLVDGRNPGMADAIEQLHGDVSVFAAVGALHMVGPAGLPQLMQAKGFKVVRVF